MLLERNWKSLLSWGLILSSLQSFWTLELFCIFGIGIDNYGGHGLDKLTCEGDLGFLKEEVERNGADLRRHRVNIHIPTQIFTSQRQILAFMFYTLKKSQYTNQSNQLWTGAEAKMWRMLIRGSVHAPDVIIQAKNRWKVETDTSPQN